MTTRARHGGRCWKCGGQIKPGDAIQWTRGVGSVHAACSEPQHTYGRPFRARFGGHCFDCHKPIIMGSRIRYRYPDKKLCHADCDRAKRDAAREEAKP